MNDFRNYGKGVVGLNYVFSNDEINNIKIISRNGSIYELAVLVAPKQSKYNEVKFISDEQSLPICKIKELDKKSPLHDKINFYVSKFLSLNPTPTFGQLQKFNETLVSLQSDLALNKSSVIK